MRLAYAPRIAGRSASLDQSQGSPQCASSQPWMIHETTTFSPLPTPLGRFARGVIKCVGVRISDYGQLKFERVRRPIFRLDREASP